MDALAESEQTDPALIVVFDIAGAVDDFRKAVARVPGLEFLAEIDEEKMPPDALFHAEDKNGPTEKGVARTLQVVMSDITAANQLVSLFNRWRADPKVKLETGLNPLKQVFAQLRDVRNWSAVDRVRETGLLEQWAQDLETAGPYVSHKRVEIELWYRETAQSRIAAENHVRSIVEANGGTVVGTSLIGDVNYHALLSDIPIQNVEKVVSDGAEAFSLLLAEDVMFVSPFKPMSFPSLLNPEPVAEVSSSERVSDSPPRVALLDGMPIANHPLLAGHITIDDPDDLAPNYPTTSRSHGTAMASLIVRGDLHESLPALNRAIYVRPILKPHEYIRGYEESPRDELFPDLLHRAIRRLFEGDGSQSPAAPSVRVINLSIGDESRIFINRMSAAARVLDWAAFTYNVLVVVSAGNHNRFSLEMDPTALADVEKLRADSRRFAYEGSRHRGLLSPAESINALTVGAVHSDLTDASLFGDTVLDLTREGHPSLYGGVGFGYRRSVKPEIMLSGGRSVYVRPPSDGTIPVEVQMAASGPVGPGQKVAAPSAAPSGSGTVYSHGTSNAAALATRAADEIFEILEDTASLADPYPWPDAQFHPMVVKALLVHSARWGAVKAELAGDLRSAGAGSRKHLTRILGYGRVETDRVIRALSNRAIVVGGGSMLPDQRQVFRFPLPADLRASADWRRLTITLAWSSPVIPGSRKYRATKLSFDAPVASRIGASPNEADHWPTRMGTVQHQVLEGHDAVAFIENDMLEIAIESQADARNVSTPVRFGVVASLEMAETSSTRIFDQVQLGLRVESRARAEAQIRPR